MKLLDLRRRFLLVTLFGVSGMPCAQTANQPTLQGAFLQTTPSSSGHVAVQHWKAQRDARIVKQDLDYSCGAASLATLLQEHYGAEVTEGELLKIMDRGESRASFADMARALETLGFKAQGFAADWAQLAALRVPVVVYLKHRKSDHFSVLRGVDAHRGTVWLADPSLGNRTYSKAQFLAMWQTRSQEDADAHLSGKFLAVLPRDAEPPPQAGFFETAPVRQSRAALRSLQVRTWP